MNSNHVARYRVDRLSVWTWLSGLRSATFSYFEFQVQAISFEFYSPSSRHLSTILIIYTCPLRSPFIDSIYNLRPRFKSLQLTYIYQRLHHSWIAIATLASFLARIAFKISVLVYNINSGISPSCRPMPSMVTRHVISFRFLRTPVVYWRRCYRICYFAQI